MGAEQSSGRGATGTNNHAINFNVPVQLFNRTLIFRKLLGEGGFAHVYLVEDTQSREQFALKRVVTPIERLPTAKREIEMMHLAASNNPPPQILRLHQATVLETPHRPAEVLMLTEYCSGGTLFDCLQEAERRHAMLPASFISHSLQQIAAALAHCHSLQLAHRDVKLTNMYRTRSPDGQRIWWKLGDFGSAITGPFSPVASVSAASRMEEQLQAETTMDCRAPEQVHVTVGSVIDTAVDVWAMGVALYMLMVLKNPFESVLGILSGAPPLPSSHPHAGTPLHTVMDHCLQLQPSLRPSMQVVSDALSAISRGEELPMEALTTTLMSKASHPTATSTDADAAARNAMSLSTDSPQLMALGSRPSPQQAKVRQASMQAPVVINRRGSPLPRTPPRTPAVTATPPPVAPSQLPLPSAAFSADFAFDNVTLRTPEDAFASALSLTLAGEEKESGGRHGHRPGVMEGDGLDVMGLVEGKEEGVEDQDQDLEGKVGEMKEDDFSVPLPSFEWSLPTTTTIHNTTTTTNTTNTTNTTTTTTTNNNNNNALKDDKDDHNPFRRMRQRQTSLETPAGWGNTPSPLGREPVDPSMDWQQLAARAFPDQPLQPSSQSQVPGGSSPASPMRGSPQALHRRVHSMSGL
jgi:serine/threonine protein kinase